MTDIYATLFGRDPPWVRPRGEQRNGTDDPNRTAGLTIGGMVGNRGRRISEQNVRSDDYDRNRQTQSEIVQAQIRSGYLFPMGPERGPPTDDFSREIGEWGAEAGRIARAAARRPRIPTDYRDAPETDTATPAFFMRGGSRREADRAAYATGTPVPYMEALTGHESGDDANAQAPTSSATGLGQFIDDTWVRLMDQYGPRYGFGEGHLAGLSRADVLELRRDPMWARIMTAEYARENAPIIQRITGRAPTEGETYLGHWLGPQTAGALIKAVDEDRRSGGRGRVARNLVSNGAFIANMPIFYTPDADVRLEGGRFVYHGGGRLRTAAEVYAAQTRAFRNVEFRAEDYPTRGD